MNRKSTAIAAALLAASASSIAIEAEQLAVPTSSALSREEVKAEMRDLRAASALPQNNEASPSPLEALEFDWKRALLVERATPVADANDRAAGDAVMARYAERFGTPDSPDVQVATTTIWVPANSVLVIEELPATNEPTAQAAAPDMAAPDIAQIFQHPAIAPATD